MSLKPFGPFLKPYRVYCILGPAAKLAEAVLELYLPLLMAKVIDDGIAKGDTGYILKMGGVMLGIVTVGLLCALVCQYVASVTSQGFGTGLRHAVFRRITSLSHAELDAFGTPSLINRVTSDVNQLQYAVAMLIRLVIRAPFLCVGGIVMAMTIDLRLSLVIIVAIPLFVLIITLVLRKTVPLYRTVQGRLDKLTRVLRENLSGVRVIRAFARTDKEQKRFGGATEEHTAASIRVGQLAVGILGGTGSGKSTLMHLLMRFYDVEAGAVLVEGRDVREYAPDALRHKVGLVPQKAELFSGTIADNIRWGDPQADDQAVRDAAVMAQADEFIRRQKDGYQSLVERGGTNLSGGQKQRLTIARALVRRPAILVLDDSSSALDYATDAALRRAIREGTAGMTVFMVSQRVSAVKQADLILMLDDGELAGAGSHEELLATCEAYREICESQEKGGDGR